MKELFFQITLIIYNAYLRKNTLLQIGGSDYESLSHPCPCL